MQELGGDDAAIDRAIQRARQRVLEDAEAALREELDATAADIQQRLAPAGPNGTEGDEHDGGGHLPSQTQGRAAAATEVWPNCLGCT